MIAGIRIRIENVEAEFSIIGDRSAEASVDDILEAPTAQKTASRHTVEPCQSDARFGWILDVDLQPLSIHITKIDTLDARLRQGDREVVDAIWNSQGTKRR